LGSEKFLDVPQTVQRRIDRGFIKAPPAVDAVGLAVIREKFVVAASTGKSVLPAVASETIISGAPFQPVRAGCAVKEVVTLAPLEEIGRSPTAQVIVPLPSLELHTDWMRNPIGKKQVGGCSTEDVVTRATDDVLDIRRNRVVLAPLAVVGSISICGRVNTPCAAPIRDRVAVDETESCQLGFARRSTAEIVRSWAAVEKLASPAAKESVSSPATQEDLVRAGDIVPSYEVVPVPSTQPTAT
jgi:hypothetical protein